MNRTHNKPEITRHSIDLQEGSNVSVLRGGTGPTILLLHGWLHSATQWMPVMARLVNDYTVLAPDFPGFGQSTPTRRSQTSITDLADISAQLCPRQPFAVIGDSLGARVALCAITSGSINCKAFIALGCPVDGLPPFLKWIAKTGCARLMLQALKALPQGLSRAVIRYVATRTVVSQDTLLNTDYFDSVLQANPTVAGCLLKELSASTELVDAQKLTGHLDTLVLRGANDPIVTQRAARRLSILLGADLMCIPNTSHSPIVEAPDALSKLVVSFLRSRLPPSHDTETRIDM